MTKLQSAMEYLMTYGWAILIIAVVLGALYQLGVFNSNQLGFSSSCLASSGFLCQNPILNTTGWLAVKFGAIGTSSLTITNTACTTNITAPTSTQGVNFKLVQGSTAILVFSCPLSSNAIGTGFKGYLWLTYTTPTQSGLVDRIAVVTGKVSTTGNVIAVLGGGPSTGGPALFAATCGGTLTVVAGNDICTFTSSGTFSSTGGSGNVAVLVVGGGGGGGGYGYSGGGGGGGVQYFGNFAVSPGTYTVTIGNGGAPGPASPDYNGISGGNSTFSTITSLGGGGGGSGGYSGPAQNGGSGGGGTQAIGPGSGTMGQGNNGGNGAAPGGGAGGGGGGAGSVGANGNGAIDRGGNGGSGLSSSITGSSLYYGGGGGGSSYSGPSAGGSGGGGAGGSASPYSAVVSGTPNTGGGGGGGPSTSGAAGGSGIVIISFNALGNGTP
ncbi:MAG: hypothetical protein KGH53_02205 [Candidatus Micrarchaeota archaeon]|nr:hypothetical protein [Candidatus Micrarchaeota archaeon]